MKYRQSLRRLQKICGACLLILSVTAPCKAQLPVGESSQMSLNGYIGAGYSGNYGDTGVSGHGLFGTGTGVLSGYYYNPNFLSFNVRPFYNRNQDNSSYTSILSDTGVDASTNFFSGSHFPGSISYSKAFSNGSTFGLPGGVGLNADAANQNFSVTWAELLPSYPSLTATFSTNSNSSTIQGVPGTTHSSSRNINLISNYRIDGWGFAGFVNRQNFSVTLPDFLAPDNTHSNSSGTSYGLSANHSLPLSGSFSTTYNRTDYSSETGAYLTNGTTNSLDSNVSFQLTQKLTVNGGVRYLTNLLGALQQSLPGGGPPLPTNDQGSHNLSLNGFGSYSIGRGFILVGFVNRQWQSFAGEDSTSTRAGGTLTYNYSRPLFGMLYFSFGMVESGNNNEQNSIGLVGSVSMKKRFGEWQVDSDFNYAQNVQTVISTYTTSNYNYGAMIRRRFGARSYWSGSYRGIQTGLSQFAGYGNRSDSFTTILNRGRYGLSGSYSQSHGTALLSTAGTLTPTQLAPLLKPDQTIYNGRVYGAGFSVTPIRKMIINVNWYRTRSDTQTSEMFSSNNGDRLYGQMQYNLRKLSFRAGYWRTFQGISANGRPPSLDNTYYFNVSRWFDIF